ncbi:hypothetical protein ACH47X_08245 [Promicromonospora kroppenstedtii]|uniref:Uncharacterized protein n=1 Tax=Promicromonospora kroppenstedtii TaxID=440482 RepID=A0ABW7XHT9_9MICO
MIIVNVGRSWPKAQSEQQRTSAIESGWPIRGTNLPSVDMPDAVSRLFRGKARNVAMLEDLTRLVGNLDFLVAVSSNVVVDVRIIDHWDVFDDRLAFKTSLPTWRASVVGERLPADLAWQRGESWPLKAVESHWLDEVVKTETVQVGDYTVHLLPNGTLHVALPQASGLVTVGSHDQPVPVHRPRATRDPDAEYADELETEKAAIGAWEQQQQGRATKRQQP